jgi:hypothetical protein
MPSPTLPSPNADFEKPNSSSRITSRTKRRGILFVFLTFALVFFYLGPVTDTSAISNTLSIFWTKVKGLAGCNTASMSHYHHTTHTTASAEGWHAHATRVSSANFAPKASDVILTVLYNSQVEPEGFTMSLVRPNLAVEASGQVLALRASDFAAFEAQVRAVSQHVEPTGAFMGQWRVKQARTGYPIDRVLIPGDAERAVYGWTKSDAELELEEETKGRSTLPKELQVLVGWAREAREGYVRGNKDDFAIRQIMALVEE